MPARPLPKHLAQTKEEITTHTARSERSQRKDRWAVTIIIIFNRSIDQSSCCIEESLKNLQFPFKSLDLNLKLPPAACGAAGATNFHVFISRFHLEKSQASGGVSIEKSGKKCFRRFSKILEKCERNCDPPEGKPSGGLQSSSVLIQNVSF